MKLVMIKRGRYVSVQVGLDPILQGQTIEVDDDRGEHLLAQTYKDSANNYHPYFVEASDPRAAKFVKDEPAPAKAAPRRRRRKAPAEAEG